GAEHTSLLGGDVSGMGLPSGAPRASAVETHYSARGTVKGVGGSYGTLITNVAHAADGLVKQIVYGDLAATTSTFQYNLRRRLSRGQTARGPRPPWGWRSRPPPSNYVPAPISPGPTSQLVLRDEEFIYDRADNPIEIHDWRPASDWPAGAKPVTRTFDYDDLY